MYIFYDFETSSRELIGQILSYCFIVTDRQFNTIDTCEGLIQLNRTQLPEIDAILTNKLSIVRLQKEGIPEYKAAERIHQFLSQHVAQEGHITLVGYNSNQFDLNFLRNLLIKYGLNPYFKGKTTNLDILHFVQNIAFDHPETFPFLLKQSDTNWYYSFKLEDIASQFNLLHAPQSHDAKEDVLLTIALVKKLQTTYNTHLSDFRPVQLPINSFYEESVHLGKEKNRVFTDNKDNLAPYHYTYWYKLLDHKKQYVLVNLSKYQSLQEAEHGPTAALRYVNPNKASIKLEPVTQEEKEVWTPVIQAIQADPQYNTLTLDDYFALIKKDWDIEYQIHELGFERIDLLRYNIVQLLDTPDKYPDLLRTLMSQRENQKDTYLLQLFNRAYLNIHPHPKPEYLKKYLTPRYLTKTMLKNPEEGYTLSEYDALLTQRIKENPEQATLLRELQQYFIDFKKNV